MGRCLGRPQVSQKLEQSNSKVTLGWVDEHTMVAQMLENQLQVMLVFSGLELAMSIISADVAKVYATQDLINEVLKCLGCIPQSKIAFARADKPKGVVMAVF